MKVADEFISPPEDYSVIVPDGWFQLPLDPDVRDRAIVALAERTFHGVDNAPHLKKELMQDLQRKAKEAYSVGGTELYLSTLSIGKVPLASSLLISIPAADEWPRTSDVEELAEHLAGPELADGAELGVVQLEAAGKAVRYRHCSDPAPEAQLGNRLPTTSVTYYVPVPATGRWLMLSFSTPLDPLADQMVELFDAVAGTLHWS
ncbi:hypothetical protein [Streptomyces sp. NPDC086787]|uniref:hypothetical protein n=1 Tax=Streptomyces sp. NPDC086787 TaxID=3365759 RepID=UPI0037FC5FF7